MIDPHAPPSVPLEAIAAAIVGALTARGLEANRETARAAVC